MSHNNQHENCCLKFDPQPWNEKVHEWQDKLFIKDSLPQFFHMPLPGMFRRTINRLWKQAQDAQATTEIKDFLLLAHDPTPWKSVFYMLVTQEVPGAENVRLSGTFVSKVFDGPFNMVPQFIRDMDIYLLKQDKLAAKYYFYYTTCPKCARKNGHNYIVAFAEV